MAFTAHFFFSSSILLFSLLVISSAGGDYEYVPKPDYSYSSTPKPESVKPDVVKPDNEYSPKPKPNSDYSPQPKTDTVRPEYEYSAQPKPDSVKPEDEYNSKPKPDNAKLDDECSPKSKHDDVKPEYGYGPKPKPDVVKPKDDYNPAQTETVKSDDGYASKPKSDNVELEGYGSKSKSDEEDVYSPKPNFDKVTIPKPDSTKPDYGYLTKPDTVKPDNYGYGHKLENPLAIGIEGLVLCKSGSTCVPVEGAVARITCEALDKNGYKTTPFSCLSGVTDAKGYFFMLLSALGPDHDNIELTDCKVKLEKSPLKNCNVPTDVNKGISGALFSSYRILHDKKIKLSSVGPFFYTSDLKSTTPTTGY